MTIDRFGDIVPLFEAIETRQSVRAFEPTPIPKDIIERLLELAARAPSGTNMQPWQTRVLTGKSLSSLTQRVCAAFDENPKGHPSEVRYYPENWFDPYVSRRRKVGWDLYGLLGIAKGDKEKMHAQHRKNFDFFGAPVGMMFTIHRDLATGSWLDYGMFLQTLMLAARAFDLHTCPQAAWADFHPEVRDELNLGDEEIVVCGMALGYADMSAPENTLRTEREPIDQSTAFFD